MATTYSMDNKITINGRNGTRFVVYFNPEDIHLVRWIDIDKKTYLVIPYEVAPEVGQALIEGGKKYGLRSNEKSTSRP